MKGFEYLKERLDFKIAIKQKTHEHIYLKTQINDKDHYIFLAIPYNEQFDFSFKMLECKGKDTSKAKPSNETIPENYVQLIEEIAQKVLQRDRIRKVLKRKRHI